MKKYACLLGLFAISCALLLLITVGCGTTNHNLSLQLTANSGSASSSGTQLPGALYDLVGMGGTVQLQAMLTTSNQHPTDVTASASYTISVDPNLDQDYAGAILPTPPAGVTLSRTGLVTAVDPGLCTWVNLGTNDEPASYLTGAYIVTATFRGVTSQPVYIGVASSSAGNKPCPYPGAKLSSSSPTPTPTPAG